MVIQVHLLPLPEAVKALVLNHRKGYPTLLKMDLTCRCKHTEKLGVFANHQASLMVSKFFGAQVRTRNFSRKEWPNSLHL